MAQVGNEEQIIREIMNALSGSARYMADEIKGTFSKYVDIYRSVSGFETQQISLGTVENKRVFLVQSSITEPNYDPGNYLVNAFKGGFFNINENFFPTYLMGGIECYMQSAPSESTGVKVSGSMVSIYNGVESVEDKDMGQVVCAKKASIKFSDNVTSEVSASPGDLFRVAFDVINNVRNRFSGIRDDFVNTYGFEPGDITLTGNEVMLSTLFDLSMSSTMRDYIQRVFSSIVPGQVPELMGLGLLCGAQPDLVFSYDDMERILVLGHPHKVSSGDCLKYSIIKYA
ncbi:hypothetical protein [Vulcanisaeta distributa]|uniref:hypothetical protein n=1 Tax=Vulcanisaeta distributa TaxID=164451 RepID=UPI0006D1725A|nr:hypothetical protein [Vulcanisaeta distributa]